MAFEFKLPDIGEGVVEGEIVEWFVKAGDAVSEDQPLVAVMTDKATVDIPSPKAGTVTHLGGAPGEIIKVGAVLVTLDGDPGAAAPAPAEAAPAKPEPATAKPAAAETRPAAKEPPAAAPAPRPAPRPAPARAEDAGRVLASPATRKLAREMGIDLASVAGSGPRGRVTPDDVRQAAARPAPAPVALAAAAAAPAGPPRELLAIPRRGEGTGERVEERVPLRGLRKRIAQKMVESKQRAPHFAYVEECDVTELVALRQRLKPSAERYGVKLTYLPFIMKALVPCLREFPLLNSSLDDETDELVFKKYYNIGVATDTDKGLTVPVVHDVNRKSILEIAAEIVELTNRARAGRSKLEDLQGGTFTITSTGNIGGLFATPIINHPEVAILGVPKIRQQPVVREGQVVIRDILWVAMSLDHRVVDGAVGARFTQRLIEYLSDPAKIFLELA